LYVWGPNPFTNQLLASHIESFAGMPPQCLCSGAEAENKIFESSCMVFCDCDKVDSLSYCRLLQRPGINGERTPGITLMNVPPEHDLLDEIKAFNIFGIFYSTDNFELIGKGIQKVLAGEHWLSRKLLVRSLQLVRKELRKEKSESLTPLLTLREQEILKLVAVGSDNQAIADQLYISPNTVKTHISNIYKKIDATNRVQAIIWASENAGQLLSFSNEPVGEFRLPLQLASVDGYEKSIR